MANKSVTFSNGVDTIYAEPKPWIYVTATTGKQLVNIPTGWKELYVCAKVEGAYFSFDFTILKSYIDIVGSSHFRSGFFNTFDNKDISATIQVMSDNTIQLSEAFHGTTETSANLYIYYR